MHDYCEKFETKHATKIQCDPKITNMKSPKTFHWIRSIVYVMSLKERHALIFQKYV
jgi:hypothetical protein